MPRENDNSKNKTSSGGNHGIWAIAIIVIMVALAVSARNSSTPKASASLDTFAQCLAKKNITMYGAYWCPHCQNQKAEFGSSFKYVPYVECTVETQKCVDAKINGYPTWILPDGTRLEGEQTLQKLSGMSGCELPAGYQP